MRLHQSEAVICVQYDLVSEQRKRSRQRIGSLWTDHTFPLSSTWKHLAAKLCYPRCAPNGGTIIWRRNSGACFSIFASLFEQVELARWPQRLAVLARLVVKLDDHQSFGNLALSRAHHFRRPRRRRCRPRTRPKRHACQSAPEVIPARWRLGGREKGPCHVEGARISLQLQM